MAFDTLKPLCSDENKIYASERCLHPMPSVHVCSSKSDFLPAGKVWSWSYTRFRSRTTGCGSLGNFSLWHVVEAISNQPIDHHSLLATDLIPKCLLLVTSAQTTQCKYRVSNLIELIYDESIPTEKAKITPSERLSNFAATTVTVKLVTVKMERLFCKCNLVPLSIFLLFSFYNITARNLV